METGSVVGIQVEVAGMYTVTMYTGTLIRDLMAVVERAERSAERKRVADEQELRRLYELQVAQVQVDQILVGAA